MKNIDEIKSSILDKLDDPKNWEYSYSWRESFGTIGPDPGIRYGDIVLIAYDHLDSVLVAKHLPAFLFNHKIEELFTFKDPKMAAKICKIINYYQKIKKEEHVSSHLPELNKSFSDQ